MKKQTAIIFYVLSIYVVLQFSWWAYHLIDLASKIGSPGIHKKQTVMILGEGAVFFALLIFGLWLIRRSIQKEMLMSKRQNNFLLSVTHELKTPIASNKLYLQTLLKRSNFTREQQEDLIEHALAENKRLEDMIENILTATQIENQHVKLNYWEYDLGQEFTRLIENWSATRVPVTLDLEPNVIVKADIFILETVLINLLENAFKYGGENPNIEVYLRRDQKNVIWGVKDSGIGIPPEERKDIFKKFVRIGNEETRSKKGTGLGLYIAKNLLSFHKGTIVYFPNKPKGSHFKVTL